MAMDIKRLAETLYSSGAIKFGCFKLKSGIESPYYIDLSWLLSSPEDFRYVVNSVAEMIREITSNIKVDKLATIELKGALLLPSIASELNIPCLVVRKEEKTYGLTGRISGGTVERGDKIIFFDDVVTDAKSKIEGMRPLEDLGGEVCAVVTVVDREQGGRENLERMGYKFHSLAKITDLIEALLDLGVISEEAASNILDYVQKRRNPIC